MAAPQAVLPYQSVVLVDTTGQPVNVTGNALNTSAGGSTTSSNITQWAGTAVALNNGATSAGTLRVTLSNDSTGQVTLASGATVALGAGAATIGALTANQSVNVAQINGVTTTMGNGVSGTGVQRVTIASDSTGQVALAAGTAVVGQVNLAPQTSGGTTMYHAVNPNNVTGVVVKNSAGQLYGVTMATSAAAPAYLKLYDSSSAPTAGSGTIKMALICPASAASSGAGASYQFPNGVAFASGIAYTFVSLVTDADNTQPTQNTFTIDITYK
jgi:hypothetical protein